MFGLDDIIAVVGVIGQIVSTVQNIQGLIGSHSSSSSPPIPIDVLNKIDELSGTLNYLIKEEEGHYDAIMKELQIIQDLENYNKFAIPALANLIDAEGAIDAYIGELKAGIATQQSEAATNEAIRKAMYNFVAAASSGNFGLAEAFPRVLRVFAYDFHLAKTRKTPAALWRHILDGYQAFGERAMGTTEAPAGPPGSYGAQWDKVDWQYTNLSQRLANSDKDDNGGFDSRADFVKAVAQMAVLRSHLADAYHAAADFVRNVRMPSIYIA